MTKPELPKREESLIAELNDAHLRSFQLEKAIKWWSECTASWRERWGRVRSHRNKLREEITIVRGQYKSLTVEYAKIKTERDSIKMELDSLRPEKQIARVTPFDNCDKKFEDAIMSNLPLKKISTTSISLNSEISFPYSNFSVSSNLSDYDELDKIDHLLFVEDIENLQEFIVSVSNEDSDDVNMKTKINNELICDKLEKVKKYIRSCQKCLESKTREITELKSQNEVVEKRLGVVDEKCNDEIKILDKPTTPPTRLMTSPIRLMRNTSTEMTMKELHAEIERLQQENCNEWTKREQCETNMADMKRELNSANQRIKELEEDLTKKNENISKAQAMNMQMLNEALDEKSKCLLDIKAVLNKTRKQLQDKTDALTHEKNRTEQYDGELKKLRARIDVLKKQLVTAEEKVDSQNNHARRLQRSLDEQMHTNDALQAQLDHVNSRLKRELAKNNFTSGDEKSKSDNERP